MTDTTRRRGAKGRTRLSGGLLAGRPVDLVATSGRLESVEVARGDAEKGASRRSSGTRAGPHELEASVDLEGFTLLPALAEPHAHLDKAFLADRVANPRGDLAGAIEAVDAAFASLDEADLVERAERCLAMAVAAGCSALRSHVDVSATIGTLHLEWLAPVRERWRDRLEVQLAALVDVPLSGREGRPQRRLAERALEAGADVVGGAPWLDERPAEAIAFLCGLAAEAGRPIDLHLDEATDPRRRGVEAFVREVERRGLGGRAVASHAVGLAARDPRGARRAADALAGAGVAVVVAPQTNLYLQARGLSTRQPRGIAPVRLLKEAGVVVAAGGDNVQDPFNPLGRADPLETAALLVVAAHLSPEEAVEAVGPSARGVLGLEPARLEAGDVADFVAVRASGVREALALAPGERVVVRSGRVVSRRVCRGGLRR